MRVQALERAYDETAAERRELVLQIAALPDGPESNPGLLRRFQDTVRECKDLRQQALEAVYAGGDVHKDTNYVFPHFIFEFLPALLLGLIVAAIFAAGPVTGLGTNAGADAAARCCFFCC